jgi:hypothetical protein
VHPDNRRTNPIMAQIPKRFLFTFTIFLIYQGVTFIVFTPT